MTKGTGTPAISVVNQVTAVPRSKRAMDAWPVIGVSCPVSYDYQTKGYTYSRPGQYLTAVEAAKGLAFPLPPNPDQLDDQVRMLDGIVLTGGGDIDPFAYGIQVPNRHVYGVSDRRDEYEFALLNAALKAGIPILGICRGLQLINIGFGGTLWQDIEDERPNGKVKLKHTGGGYVTYSGNSHDGGYHMVRVRPDSLAADVYRSDTVQVNSYHHQAVRNLGEGLHICGRTADGVVESIAHNTLPILGLQFHPEMMQGHRHEHRRPFRWLIAEATRAMKAAGGRRAGVHEEDRGRIRLLRSEARAADRAAEARARATARTKASTSVKPAPAAPGATKPPVTATNIQTGASVPPAPATSAVPAPYQMGQAEALAGAVKAGIETAVQTALQLEAGPAVPPTLPQVPTVADRAEAAKQAGLSAAAAQLNAATNELIATAQTLDQQLDATLANLRANSGQANTASLEAAGDK